MSVPQSGTISPPSPAESRSTGSAPAEAGPHFAIPSLDGIRAISILLVVVSHCGLSDVVPGGLGVTIFFFLSGYLITTLLRREAAGTGTINLKHFYIRRCLRIFPPCFLVLTVALLVAVVMKKEFTWLGVAANFGYATNYFGIFGRGKAVPGMDVLWSLAVEEHFYLAFPLLYLSILHLSRKRQSALLVLICLAVLAWRCYLVFCCHTRAGRTYAATDTRLDSILLGCLFAISCNPALGDRHAPRVAHPWFAVMGGALVLFTIVYRAPWFRETFRYSIQGIALIPLFAISIERHDRFPFRSLNTDLLRTIGVYSYTIYLCHFALAHYLAPEVSHANFLRNFLVVFSLSMLVAAIMYRFVDLPCARIRKRLAWRRLATVS